MERVRDGIKFLGWARLHNLDIWIRSYGLCKGGPVLAETDPGMAWLEGPKLMKSFVKLQEIRIRGRGCNLLNF